MYFLPQIFSPTMSSLLISPLKVSFISVTMFWFVAFDLIVLEHPSFFLKKNSLLLTFYSIIIMCVEGVFLPWGSKVIYYLCELVCLVLSPGLGSSQLLFLYLFLFLFLFLLSFFRATPASNRISQARGWIRAIATGPHLSHNNMRSTLFLWPIPQLTAMPDS